MKLYPEDVMKAVEQSKKIAEDSKKCVQTPKPNPSQVDGQWQAVKRGQK